MTHFLFSVICRVLSEKMISIQVARETIYKNNVLVHTWKHEQELRFAVDQVNQFKENLKIWEKGQREEREKRLAEKKKKIGMEHAQFRDTANRTKKGEHGEERRSFETKERGAGKAHERDTTDYEQVGRVEKQILEISKNWRNSN